MYKYKVIVCFANGEKILLNDVTDYSVNSDKKLINVIINGYKQIFNLNFVSYIGMADYLKQDDEE